jgi:hypothetical protein
MQYLEENAVVNERLRAMDHSDYGQVFCACAKLSMIKDRLNVTWLSAHALIANIKRGIDTLFIRCENRSI